MNFDQYFNENFIELDNGCYAKSLSTTSEYRPTVIDKDDLMELWEAAIESINIIGENNVK